MATMTEAIRLIISGDSKGGVKALGDVAGAAEKTQGVFGKYGKGLNTAANYAAVGVAGLTAVIGKSVSTYNTFGESVDTITDLTNLSTESASRLSGQLQQFDVDAAAAGTAVKLFEKNLDAARQGNETMVESFARLGISAEELQTLGDDELLLRTRDAMASLDDKTARTALTLKVFGKAGAALADWLDVAPGDMAKVNAELERAGLIWGDKELRTWQDMLDVQREMKISMLGIQIVIARDVVPALTPMVRLFGQLLRFLRPIAPVLVPLTGALAVFVGVVKGANLVQGAWNNLLKLLPSRLLKAKVAEEGATVATQAGTRAMRAQILQLGLYGIAIAAAAVAIYGIVKAYNAWRDAADDAATAADNAMATLEKNKAKLSGEQYAADKAAINRDRYKSPSGALGWLRAAFEGMWNYNPLTSGLPRFGSGGDFIARGAQQIVVGDNPVGERVQITPLNNKGSGGETHFHLHIGQLIGTDERAARQLWNTVKPIAMSDLRMKMAMSRG